MCRVFNFYKAGNPCRLNLNYKWVPSVPPIIMSLNRGLLSSDFVFSNKNVGDVRFQRRAMLPSWSSGNNSIREMFKCVFTKKHYFRFFQFQHLHFFVLFCSFWCTHLLMSVTLNYLPSNWKCNLKDFPKAFLFYDGKMRHFKVNCPLLSDQTKSF